MPKQAAHTKPSVAKQPAAKARAKQADPAAVDAWLNKLPDPQRQLLQQLRTQVKAAAPALIETIAWNVPMYYLGTAPLLGFNAFKRHASIGVGSETIDALRDQLAAYDFTKDTIRFTPDKPLPATLVKKLVKTRLAVHVAKGT